MKMDNKSQHKIRLLILGIVFVIAIIVVIASVNKNKVNVTTENKQISNVKTNFTQLGTDTKLNTSEELSQNKKVGDVLLEKSKIVYDSGVSTLTSKVTNNGTAKNNLRFKVKFIANDGSVIAETVGFVGQIKANETKYINASITLDTSNSKNITYELIP